jgi:Flp pilus assembly CpaF family ATPase
VRDIIASAIRERVAEDLASPEAAALVGEDRREFARRQIFAHLDLLSAGEDRWLHADSESQPVQADEQRLAQSVLDALFGMGRLQSLIDDPDIENIDINGCDRVWATYADGSKRMMPDVADSDEELIDLVRSAASRFGLSERRFDLARPELDLRLPDGSRLSALMAVVARPAVSIRRHRFSDLSLSDLRRLGSIDEGLESLLRSAVRARKNIVVSGAMNTGKTTLLRALASEIPPRERLVTIEQAFELGLDTSLHRHPDMVALEARQANMEGAGLISVADLVRRALRMNADRVIVGEVLGDEVLPMLNAMSQGRSGSMCSIHADSSAGVFRRIASYAVQAPERLPLEASNLLVAGAVHLVVHLDSEMHDPLDGSDGTAEWVSAPSPGAWSGEPGGWSRLDSDHLQDRTPFDEAPTAGPDANRRDHQDSDFGATAARARFVSSIREVVDAEGVQVVSNEVYRPGPDRRAVPVSPLRPETLRELSLFGYEPPRSEILSALV